MNHSKIIVISIHWETFNNSVQSDTFGKKVTFFVALFMIWNNITQICFVVRMFDYQLENSNLERALLTQQVRPQHLQFGICIIKLMIKYVSIKKSNRLVLSSSQNRNKLFPFAFHNWMETFLREHLDFHESCHELGTPTPSEKIAFTVWPKHTLSDTFSILPIF